MKSTEMLASFSGFDDFLVYFGIAAVLLIIFIFIYIRITPYKELQLIREGNNAAAISLAGTIFGMVIPVAHAIEYSVGLIDMAIWAAIALAVQLLVFVVARMTLPEIAKDIPAGKTASGIFLGTISVAAGVLSAACMSY
jgi:putative membrane protein